MSVYAGMAVGGPYAGRLIAHRAPVFECVERNQARMSLRAWHSRAPGSVPVSTERYHWHNVEGHGLWLLEGQTIADAINELVVGYQERHRG